jgi:alpha,alpha-trehalase
MDVLSGLETLFVVAAVSAVAPILAVLVPGQRIPQLILLILGGVLIGPEVLGLEVSPELELIANVGLGMVFLLAGFEINPAMILDRVGNGAYDQRQNDVFGAVLASLLLHTRRSERLPRRRWPIVESQAECATAVWRQPDQGIWEARGKPQHYASSKLMCWVALDRASKLAEIRGDADRTAAWKATADEIKADILAHGVDRRGVLRQHYDTDALDASTLLAAIFGFLPADDDRLRASVRAIADELTEHGFALRYRTDETDDGLSGKEGTFLICSFWLVSALAIIGEQQEARDLMERLLRIASPLGLFAEEFDVDTGRHLGNFPQAFSHLALIEAAARIILAERVAEFW